MSTASRQSYVNAVQCLMSSPAKSDPSFAPGARTRYDDFVAVHINQTLSIHGTVSYKYSVTIYQAYLIVLGQLLVLA
jgi:tyrosinase